MTPRFVREYLTGYPGRHAGSTLGQLREVVTETPTEPIKALEKRFGEWEETRARKIGFRETVQLGAAGPLIPRRNVGHAPAPGGCDCTIAVR